MSVLVAYASAHGSTKEIAERVAQRLTQRLAPTRVECVPAPEVARLSTIQGQYSAVVLGSAVHAQKWIRPGRQFLADNAGYLTINTSALEAVEGGAHLPPAPALWAFSVGFPRSDEDLAREEAKLEKQIRGRLGDHLLRGHRLFRGVMVKKDVPWIVRVFLSCCAPKEGTLYGDNRDWAAIEAYADEIADTIREAGLAGKLALEHEAHGGEEGEHAQA